MVTRLRQNTWLLRRIIHETTVPYTPQQNGVAERKNRALKEMINSMLSYSGLSEGAVVRLPDPKRKTLGEKGIDCIFVGYAEHSKAYRFYVIEPNDSVSINSIIESRDAIFDENRLSSIPRPKDIIPNLVESQRDDHYDDLDHKYSLCFSIMEDLRTYDEAMQSRDAAFWKEAIDDEIGSIMENNTWVLSDLPPGCKPLGCKWIFKRKMKVDRTIDKFKARLVIQGFRQKEGIDYFDTYAPVARITTIRLLLALAYSQSSDPSNGCQNSILEWFSMKDMGDADVILGIKIKRENKGIIITQSHYIEKILKKFNREDCSPRYYELWFIVEYPSVLEAYSDASWINHVEDSSSTSGWVHLLGGGANSWASKKQTCITGSTMKSEFVTLAAAGKEAEWLRNLIHEIPIWPKLISLISIHCDRAATLAKAYSQMYNGKSRHVGVTQLFRSLIINGVISIEFVRSQQNLADHLMKVSLGLVNKSVIGWD
ncbi:zinc finger, CCHC-type containing protein [Tanacetum coccineum]